MATISQTSSNGSPAASAVAAASHPQSIPVALFAIRPLPSAPSLEERAIQKMNSEHALWQYEGREFDAESGGWRNEYKIKLEVNTFPEFRKNPLASDATASKKHLAAFEKQKELYPATEKLDFEMAYLSEDKEIVELWKKWYENKFGKSGSEIMLKAAPILRKLGYAFECKGDVIHIKKPDAKLLQYRWNKLREEKPELPELNFISCDGNTTVSEFINAHRTSSGVLSTGKEMVHDHQYHVIAAILLILNPAIIDGQTKTYQSYKQDLNAWMGETYDFVATQKQKSILEGKTELTKMLDVVEAVIGVLIDQISSFVKLENIYYGFFSNTLENRVKSDIVLGNFNSKNFEGSVVSKVCTHFEMGHTIRDIVNSQMP